MRIAAQRGITHARLALRPQGLGGIEIRLLASEAGLVASVVADNAQAAQALERAGADLRRTLESQGLNLLRLDIGQSGGEGATPFGSGDGERRMGSGGLASETSAEADYPGESDAETTIELPNGVLVDVLA